MANDIRQTVRKIIGDQLGFTPDEIAPTDRITDDLADSLDVIEITMALEEQFSLDIPDSDVEDMETVEHVENYMEAHASVATVNGG